MIVYEQRKVPMTLEGDIKDAIKKGVDKFEKLVGDSAEKSDKARLKDAKTVTGPASDYVKAVGNDLVQQIRSSRRDFGYKFTLVDSPVINAWAWPNGSIYITTGLLSKLRSKDALAAIMGHEIVHAAEHHGAKKVGLGVGSQAGIIALTKLFFGKLSQDDIDEYGGLVQLGMNNSYGRETEKESDWRGQRMAARAGYSPKGAAEVMNVFLSLRTKKPGLMERWFSTHPYPGDRVKDAESREKEYEDIARVDPRTGKRSRPSVGSYITFLGKDLNLPPEVVHQPGDSDIGLSPIGIPRNLPTVLEENLVPLIVLGGAVITLGVVLLWN